MDYLNVDPNAINEDDIKIKLKFCKPEDVDRKYSDIITFKTKFL